MLECTPRMVDDVFWSFRRINWESSIEWKSFGGVFFPLFLICYFPIAKNREAYVSYISRRQRRKRVTKEFSAPDDKKRLPFQWKTSCDLCFCKASNSVRNWNHVLDIFFIVSTDQCIVGFISHSPVSVCGYFSDRIFGKWSLIFYIFCFCWKRTETKHFYLRSFHRYRRFE